MGAVSITRKISVTLIFVAFLLGTLPVRHLHDMFAAHTEHISGCGDHARHHGQCVYDASLVCKMHQWVVDLPYYFNILTEGGSPAEILPSYFFQYQEPFISSVSISRYDRGPPCMIS